MQKLLTAALLLAGCTLHQASAQKAPLPPSTVASAPSSPTPALHWAAAEFCEAYGHYYQDLPSLYRYNAGQALQHTPLAMPNADLAKLLTQQPDLREAVYKTIYQYCHTLKYGMDDQHEIEELVYFMLYHDLHMSSLAATHLAPHISSDYQQSVPTLLDRDTTPPTASLGTPDREQSRTIYTPKTKPAQPRTVYIPKSVGNSHGTANYSDYGPEVSSWRLDTQPVVENMDGSPGMVRFKIKISDNGEVASVTKVSGSVSPAQEKACRDQLANLHFVKDNPSASATTGFYTFRFSVR